MSGFKRRFNSFRVSFKKNHSGLKSQDVLLDALGKCILFKLFIYLFIYFANSFGSYLLPWSFTPSEYLKIAVILKWLSMSYFFNYNCFLRLYYLYDYSTYIFICIIIIEIGTTTWIYILMNLLFSPSSRTL